MKRLIRVVVTAAAGAVLTALLVPLPESEAVPDRSSKTATMTCRPGWRGSAVGQYGGVGFSVSCNNGRGQQRINGTVGTAYSVRMGVESDTLAVDCAFSGDAATVNETCAEVRLTIR